MTTTPADIPAPPPLSVSRGAALYIGALLGPGLLLLPGLAAAQAGPASVLAWAALIGLSAMLAAVFTALGRAVPSAGGVAGYTAAGLGRRAGAVAGWCFLAGVVCGAPIVCLIGASYVTELVGGGQLMRAAVAAALLLAVLGLALGGVRATTLAQLVLIALLIVVVVIAVAGSATADRAANWAPFAPHGWLAVGRAASTLMLSFVGWEAVAPLTTRFRDPARQLPRVTGIAFGTTALLYLGLATATIGALGRGAGTDVPLAALLRLAVGPAGRAAAAVAAIVLTLGATNAYLTGAGQMITQLTAGRRAARSSRPFLLLIAAAGLTLIGLYALHIVSTAGMVALPVTMFLCVYLGCTASAARILTGPARVAAIPAVLAVAGMMAWCGWALAAAAAVAAAAALGTRTRPTALAIRTRPTATATRTRSAPQATRTRPAAPATGTSAAAPGPSPGRLTPPCLLLHPVLQPLPGQLALAAALIGQRGPLGLVQIHRGQQAVGEEELSQLARVAPLRPDEPLQQLLVVGDRAFAAQVQGDGHVGHRHRLRRGQAEDVLLVVVGHRHPRGAVALEVGADVCHRLLPGPAGPAARTAREPVRPDPRVLGGGLVAARAGGLGGAARRDLEPQPQHPGADADQPRPVLEDDRQRLVVLHRCHRQDVPGRRPHRPVVQGHVRGVRRQVDLVGRVAAEQLPPVVHVAQPGAAGVPVQGEVLVAGQQAPVQPGDLIGRAAHPHARPGRPDKELAHRHFPGVNPQHGPAAGPDCRGYAPAAPAGRRVSRSRPATATRPA
jgi:amino acid efflux transporter